MQGEVLVEMSMEPATESEVAVSMHPHTVGGPVNHARERHLTLKQDFFIAHLTGCPGVVAKAFV